VHATNPAIIPPAPRQLTPLGLRRLRREFAPSWTERAFTALILLWFPVLIAVAFGPLDDLRFEIWCRETMEFRILSADHEAPPYAVSFEFWPPRSDRVVGTCFTNDASKASLDRSFDYVQYDPARPTVSRLTGTRCGVFSWRWITLFINELSAVFLYALCRRRRLCEHGQVTAGRLLRQSRLDALFFRRRILRAPCRYTVMSFHFRDAAGRSHKGRAVMRRTPFRLEPGDEVTVIYDPLKTRRSICVEALGIEFIPKPDQTGSQDQEDRANSPASRSCCGPGR